MENKIQVIDSLYKKDIIKNKIESITIHNFRAFEEETKVNFNYPLTIFVGKNGSGKSTMLKIINTLHKNYRPENYFFESDIDEGDKGKEYAFSFEINGREYLNLKKKKQWMVIKNKENRRYTEWLNDSDIFKRNIRKINTNFSIESIIFKNLIGAFDKNLYLENISRTKNLDRRISKTIKASRGLVKNKNYKSRNMKGIKFTSEKLDIVNSILEKEYKEISIFEHRYYNGTWGTTVLFKNDKEYSEFNAGSGEFIISVVVNKIESMQDNSLLLLDEPEISLHPGAQGRLISYILDVIKRKKMQVIISTHSPAIIDKLPSKCIKLFRENQNNKYEVYEDINYLEAFYDLEQSFDKKKIIVEDDLAKNILLAICKEENYLNLFDINYYPGGAESIKTLLITAFSKSKSKNKFIIFDGDKYKKDVIDLENVLEKDKDIYFYEKEFKAVTNVNSKSIKWGVDGNAQKDNKELKNKQLSLLIKEYLNYYKNNVFFFPQQIPEEIIFDGEYLKQAYSHIDLSQIDSIKNYKDKFYKLSELTDIDISSLEKSFISYFVKKKTSNNYEKLKNILKTILER